MSRRTRSPRQSSRSAPARPPVREVTDAEVDEAIAAGMVAAAQSNAALHQMFDRQVRDLMDNAGLTEEEKQTVLVAMACPCCGSGTASFTYKLRPKS